MSENEKPESQSVPAKSLPHSMRTRDPWPMWPIALAIVLFIGVYTWVNIDFRKEGKAFEPFQAMMDRKNAIVEKNFYDWYSLKTTRSSDPSVTKDPAAATTRAYPNALDEVVPEQLKYYMAGKPVLLPSFTKTESPKALTPGQPLRLSLQVPEALAGDESLQLLAFYKEGNLFLLATLFVEKIEDLDPALLSGETVSDVFEIPTEPIDAATIEVSFLTQDRLTEWKIENLDPAAATP